MPGNFNPTPVGASVLAMPFATKVAPTQPRRAKLGTGKAAPLMLSDL